jgi:hypothetical protein
VVTNWQLLPLYNAHFLRGDCGRIKGRDGTRLKEGEEFYFTSAWVTDSEDVSVF